MSLDKETESPLGTIREVDLGDIEVSDDNVRLSAPTAEDLGELAASIRRHGLLQPVVLLGKYGAPPYQLVSGQRRFLAHKQILKVRTIRAVFAGNLTRTQSVVRSLVENMQRVELEYADTAKAVTYLYDKFGKDEKRVSTETGLSLRRIRDYILIESRATPTMKSWMKSRKVTPTDVKRSIRAAQDNLNKAEELLELIMKYKPTVHQKRRIVLYGESDKRASAKSILEQALKPHVEENIIITLPDDLRNALVKATKSLEMEPDELASKILSDWLRTQGFAS
jgi:ParB family chromosome partitioning protein